jgi:hypothetical protein
MELLFLELVNDIPRAHWEDRATDIYDDILKHSHSVINELIPLLTKECVQPLSLLCVTFVLNLPGIRVSTGDGKRRLGKELGPIHRSRAVKDLLLSPQFRPMLDIWWGGNPSVCDATFNPSKKHFHTFWESKCGDLGGASNAQLLHVVYYRLGVVSSLVTLGASLHGRRDGFKWKADDSGSSTKSFNLCGETFLHVLLKRMGLGCIYQITGIGERLETKRQIDSTVDVLPISCGGVVRGHLVLLKNCFSDQFVSAHTNKLFPQLSFCQDPNDKNPRFIRFETMSHENEKKYST